jgi:hypothetical protein
LAWAPWIKRAPSKLLDAYFDLGVSQACIS